MTSVIIKIYATLCIFAMLLNGLNAQEAKFGQNIKDAEQEEVQPLKKGFTPDVSIFLGSSFTSFAPGYNAFGTYIAPEFEFPVSNRFAISAGIGYSSIFYSGGSNLFSNKPMNYGTVHLSGSYQMNEKLTISGTGYKTFLLYPPDPIDNGNVEFYDNSNQGVILHMDYKVNENFHINASFQFHQQNGSPYNMMHPANSHSPYNSMGGFSPYYNQGFYPGF